jgi:hypothetical protein
MTEKKLDDLIDKASEEKVRQCLKQIVGEWYVEDTFPLKAGAEKIRTVNPDKELNSDTIAYVSEILQAHGFYPKG